MSSLSAVGIDIGGSKVAGALVEADGTIRHRIQRRTPASGGAALLDQAIEVARAVIDAARSETPSAHVVGVGVGTAGVVRDGIIASANELIADWTGVDLGGTISAATGLPVDVLNDVHASAYCEGQLGSAAARGDALIVAVGTGIGGALLLGGSLVRGTHGASGSIGHMPATIREGRRCACGGVDHIEAYASGPALER